MPNTNVGLESEQQQTQDLAKEKSTILSKLLERWHGYKQLHPALAEHIDLSSLIFALNQKENQSISSAHFNDIVAYIEKLLEIVKTTIINSNKAPDYNALETELHNKALLKEGARLVKALDVNNPLSKRAKKYLGFGIGAMVFGVAWIAALVLGGIFLGPLTAFSITSTVTHIFGPATTTTIAIPVWAAALGGAAIPSIIITASSLMKLASNPPSEGVRMLGKAVFAIEPIGFAAIFLLSAVGVCLVPFAPLIVGAYLLKKAHTLSKAPAGLALTLATTFPALAEKTHYGDEIETAHAKLKKAEGKLSAFEERVEELKDTIKINPAWIDKKYALAGKAYYKDRVNYLKDLAAYRTIRLKKNKGKVSEPVKNSKEKLLAVKMMVEFSQSSDRFYKRVSVNDHSKPTHQRLTDELSGTLFANHYHVKHAMKVEAARRAQEHRSAASLQR